MTATNIEIIEFHRPLANDRNLFVYNIPSTFEEMELYEFLHRNFSQYGLLYEIQIMNNTNLLETTSSTGQDTNDGANQFAFVKFYSKNAALRAKKELTGRMFVKGQHIKVKFANRKSVCETTNLYVSKCYELANYYLGYNGWSSKILTMRTDETEESKSSNIIRYICALRIELLNHNLHSEGIGLGEQQWNPNDHANRGLSLCKAKKQAFRRAMEAAWSKVLFVILPDGRTHVEVNTTIQELVHYEDDLNTTDMIKVNDVEHNVESDSEIDEDDLNIHILQLLEEETI